MTKSDKTIEKHIKTLLKYSNVTYKHKKNLKKELLDHLYSVKDCYIETGLSEENATELAIKEFQTSNFLTQINEHIPEPKYNKISVSKFIKTNILLMIFYFIMTISTVIILNQYPTSNVIYFAITLLISSVIFMSAELTYNNRKTIIKSIILTSIVFFLLEKVSIIFISIIYSLYNSNGDISILNLYVFDINKIIIYFISVLMFILLAYYKHNINIEKETKDIFKISISHKDLLTVLLSSVLMLIYAVFPNRFYLLSSIISRVFNIEITSFSKNIFYMTINNTITVFNLGFIILITLIMYKLIKSSLKQNIINKDNNLN